MTFQLIRPRTTGRTESRTTRPVRGPLAVVLGGGSIEVVRALALSGATVGVVAPAGDPTRLSRHTRSILTWDWPADRNDAALAERLVEFARRQAEPPVLLHCTDQSMLFVSRQRELLAEGFRFVAPAPDVVEAVADKARFSALAAAESLPVPATVVLVPDRPAPPEEFLELGFPMVLKPIERDATWKTAVGGDIKALRVRSREQLMEFWPRLKGLSTPAVVQQCIPGPESAIVSYHVYQDQDGHIAGEFTGRKIRTVPTEYGFTSSLTVTDDAQVARLGREVSRALDLRGVAKLDFKYAPNGRLYLLEINARCSLWVHAGARAGVNLPALAYADLAGRPRPPAAPARPGLVWVHPKDVLAARRDGISTSAWLAWLWRTRPAAALWRWDDPMPLLGSMALQAGEAATGALRRRPG